MKLAKEKNSNFDKYEPALTKFYKGLGHYDQEAGKGLVALQTLKQSEDVE